MTYEEARLKNAVVQTIEKAGLPIGHAVAALVEINQELQKRVIALEAICPKKYRAADGRVCVWHCPDELIPITDLSFLSGAENRGEK